MDKIFESYRQSINEAAPNKFKITFFNDGRGRLLGTKGDKELESFMKKNLGTYCVKIRGKEVLTFNITENSLQWQGIPFIDMKADKSKPYAKYLNITGFNSIKRNMIALAFAHLEPWVAKHKIYFNGNAMYDEGEERYNLREFDRKYNHKVTKEKANEINYHHFFKIDVKNHRLMQDIVQNGLEPLEALEGMLHNFQIGFSEKANKLNMVVEYKARK